MSAEPSSAFSFARSFARTFTLLVVSIALLGTLLRAAVLEVTRLFPQPPWWVGAIGGFTAVLLLWAAGRVCLPK